MDNRLIFRLPVLAVIVTLLAGCSLFSVPLTTEQRTTELEVQYELNTDKPAFQRLANSSTIKVLSLNLAHGRKDKFTQFFVGESEIRQNLIDIADFLKRENADIVALQEADAPSWWSGDFNHVEFLAREAGYYWYSQANHVNNWMGTYGTAILSRFPILESYGINFKPTPPTFQKGFTLAEIEWQPNEPGGEKMIIDVISLHLDFSRRSNRIEQIEEIKKVLDGRNNPTLVLGDFNSGWEKGNLEIQAFAENRKLRANRPEASNLYTYNDVRLDWILISEEFNFCNYYNAPDILSDHLAVISELVLIDATPIPKKCASG